jgi:hypothetical protein
MAAARAILCGVRLRWCKLSCRPAESPGQRTSAAPPPAAVRCASSQCIPARMLRAASVLATTTVAILLQCLRPTNHAGAPQQAGPAGATMGALVHLSSLRGLRATNGAQGDLTGDALSAGRGDDRRSRIHGGSDGRDGGGARQQQAAGLEDRDGAAGASKGGAASDGPNIAMFAPVAGGPTSGLSSPVSLDSPDVSGGRPPCHESINLRQTTRRGHVYAGSYLPAHVWHAVAQGTFCGSTRPRPRGPCDAGGRLRTGRTGGRRAATHAPRFSPPRRRPRRPCSSSRRSA